jgi:hypothetical protein
MQYSKALRSPRNSSHLSIYPEWQRVIEPDRAARIPQERNSSRKLLKRLLPRTKLLRQICRSKGKMQLGFRERTSESLIFCPRAFPQAPQILYNRSNAANRHRRRQLSGPRGAISDGNKIIQTAQNYVFKANRRSGLNGHPHRPRGQSAGNPGPRGHAG